MPNHVFNYINCVALTSRFNSMIATVHCKEKQRHLLKTFTFYIVNIFIHTISCTIKNIYTLVIYYVVSLTRMII